jgi:hypothetical protein
MHQSSPARSTGGVSLVAAQEASHEEAQGIVVGDVVGAGVAGEGAREEPKKNARKIRRRG